MACIFRCTAQSYTHTHTHTYIYISDSFPYSLLQNIEYSSLSLIVGPYLLSILYISSVQFSRSVVSDSLWPHDHSTPGLPVHHQFSEFTQTHVHRVCDAIQPSHPLSSPSPPAPIPPSIRLFSNESTLRIRWPKYWSFSTVYIVIVYINLILLRKGQKKEERRKGRKVGEPGEKEARKEGKIEEEKERGREEGRKEGRNAEITRWISSFNWQPDH